METDMRKNFLVTIVVTGSMLMLSNGVIAEERNDTVNVSGSATVNKVEDSQPVVIADEYEGRECIPITGCVINSVA
jgi:hypothetical protein